MGRPLTTEEWIAKAVGFWGQRYVYDEVEYVDSKTPVTVICREHGAWPCNPSNHAKANNKRGCPVCGGSQEKTTEQFIWEATKVHLGLYDYSHTVYKGARNKIVITCIKHGVFSPQASSHLAGTGCKRCADEARVKENLLNDVELQLRLDSRCAGWNSSVMLAPNTYQGMNQPFEVLCSVHGHQDPRLGTAIFASPHPCLKCSGTEHVHGYTTETFKQFISETFQNRYEVGEFEYAGSNTVITFQCPKHEKFKLLASSINKSPGCPLCSYDAARPKRSQGQQDRVRLTTQQRKYDWILKAKETHGDFFDYNNVNYVKQKMGVVIGCPIHGAFTQTPDSHLKGGCRKCADNELAGRYTERYFELKPDVCGKPALVYYVEFYWRDEHFFKVGITTTTVKKRFSAIRNGTVELRVIEQASYGLKDAWIVEKTIQEGHGEQFRYEPRLMGTPQSTREMRIGPSECFSVALPSRLLKEYFEP